MQLCSFTSKASTPVHTLSPSLNCGWSRSMLQVSTTDCKPTSSIRPRQAHPTDLALSKKTLAFPLLAVAQALRRNSFLHQLVWAQPQMPQTPLTRGGEARSYSHRKTKTGGQAQGLHELHSLVCRNPFVMGANKDKDLARRGPVTPDNADNAKHT